MIDNLSALMGQYSTGAPYDWPRALAYLLTGLVCGYLGSSQSLALRTNHLVRQTWKNLCPLYLLIAASTLLHGDVMWIRWVRAFARSHDLYDVRGLLQLTILLSIGVGCAILWRRYQRNFQHRGVRRSALHVWMLAGAFGTFILCFLRYVSFHHIDTALNAVWWYYSLATWWECASLSLFGVTTLLELLRTYGHF